MTGTALTVTGDHALTRPARNTTVAYGLWLLCFFGLSGLHRFYMGRWVSGLLWFVTLGLFGVGNLVDLFLMPRMIRDVNRGAEVW